MLRNSLMFHQFQFVDSSIQDSWLIEGLMGRLQIHGVVIDYPLQLKHKVRAITSG